MSNNVKTIVENLKTIREQIYYVRYTIFTVNSYKNHQHRWP